MSPETQIAVIAACSALAGSGIGAFGSALLPWLDRKQRHREHVRERFEHCAELVNQTVEWVQALQAATTTEELQARSQPMPARRLMALTLVYFPRLQGAAQALLNACVGFQSVIATSYRSHIPASAGAQALTHMPTPYQTTAAVLLDARQAMDDAIAKHAPQYVG